LGKINLPVLGNKRQDAIIASIAVSLVKKQEILGITADVKLTHNQSHKIVGRMGCNFC
jgi:hypothetical protein